jgi:hypothetical protein
LGGSFDAKWLAYKKYPLPDLLFSESYPFSLAQFIVPGFLPSEPPAEIFIPQKLQDLAY